MSSKFDNEVKSIEYKKVFAKNKNIRLDDIGQLNGLMEQYCKYFYDQRDKLSLSNDMKNSYCLAVLHFYYAIFSDESFPFVKDNNIFEWKSFEKENGPSRAQEKIGEISF